MKAIGDNHQHFSFDNNVPVWHVRLHGDVGAGDFSLVLGISHMPPGMDWYEQQL